MSDSGMPDRTTIFDLPTEPHKMYVLVRRDLSPGLRCAQGMHAVAEICLRFPEHAWEWNREGNYMIVLEVDGEDDLWSDFAEPGPGWVPLYAWHEPDLGNQRTAVAFLPPPGLNSIFSGWKLAYKETWFDRLVRWTGVK